MRRVTFVGRIFFTMVTFGAALLLLGCPQEQDMDPELWGTWEGDPVGSPITEAPISVQFGEDGEWSMTQELWGEEPILGGGYYEVDTSVSPHEIDMHIDYTEEPEGVSVPEEVEDASLLGLYSIDGEELTLAHNLVFYPAWEKRPSDIDSAETMLRLERIEGKDSESTFQIRPRREEAE